MSNRNNRLKKLLRLANKQIAVLQTGMPQSGQAGESSISSRVSPSPGVSKLGMTYKPAGGLVPWFFGLGIGAVLNFLSADPHILYVTWIALSVWIFWLISHKRWLIRIGVIATCLAFLFPFRKLINVKIDELATSNSESSISVMPYAGTDKSNPLDTDFAVHNSGSFTITNVFVNSLIAHAITSGGRGKLDNVGPEECSVKKLEPGKDFMIQSGLYHYIMGPVDSGEISISVSFEDVRRPKYIITRIFRFWLKRSEEGPRWLEKD